MLPARLDLLLLGIGMDGHTASLFPRSEALQVLDRRVVAVTGPAPFRPRLTITPPVIASARHVGLVAVSAAKSSIVAAALEKTGSAPLLPAKLACAGLWFLDVTAASRIPAQYCGSHIVLAADIGGTNARLALVDVAAKPVRIITARRYASREFSGLVEIVRAFSDEVGRLPEQACFAVACVVDGDECRAPNLP